MSVSSYLISLREKHNTFKTSIKAIISNHFYDEVTVRNLKKQKMLIKDQIIKIEEKQNHIENS
jgi:hypothetical protein